MRAAPYHNISSPTVLPVILLSSNRLDVMAQRTASDGLTAVLTYTS